MIRQSGDLEYLRGESEREEGEQGVPYIKKNSLESTLLDIAQVSLFHDPFHSFFDKYLHSQETLVNHELNDDQQVLEDARRHCVLRDQQLHEGGLGL